VDLHAFARKQISLDRHPTVGLAMEDPLATYLHDHLAGSNFAIELLENLQQRHSGCDTGAFAAAILAEVQEDRKVLEGVIEKIGTSHFDVKDAISWVAEKASRMKLSNGQPDGLSTFEALETLDLGIMGKVSLWRALGVISDFDPRLAAMDFTALSLRAQDQFNRVEKYKLSIARNTFEMDRQGAK
jgi:hypothetical protein